MFLAFVFWIGCKWIKKGGLCARGWENREPFFIDLLWGKQVLKIHKIPLVRWGALEWVGETTSAKRSYLKKATRKPIVYFLALIEVIPCLTDSGKMETKNARAFHFIKF